MTNRSTMLGVESDRTPLTREQIKKKRPIDSYVSPHFNDGGWHATPGVPEWFDPRELQPMHDRVLVELLPQKIKYENVIVPEGVELNEPSLYARVIRVGKGTRTLPSGEKRRCCCVKPGDVVIIGLHNDWQSSAGDVWIVQEQDIRVFVGQKEAYREAT